MCQIKYSRSILKPIWPHIEQFFELQRCNATHNHTNFTLIPMYKHGAYHVRYDSSALWKRLCGLKLFKGAWSKFDRENKWANYPRKWAIEKFMRTKLLELSSDPNHIVIVGSKKQPSKINSSTQYSSAGAVTEINEFRTTKICSNCYSEAKTSKSPHRYQFGQKCGTTCNRDVNAGKKTCLCCVYRNCDPNPSIRLSSFNDVTPSRCENDGQEHQTDFREQELHIWRRIQQNA